MVSINGTLKMVSEKIQFSYIKWFLNWADNLCFKKFPVVFIEIKASFNLNALMKLYC